VQIYFFFNSHQEKGIGCGLLTGTAFFGYLMLTSYNLGGASIIQRFSAFFAGFFDGGWDFAIRSFRVEANIANWS